MPEKLKIIDKFYGGIVRDDKSSIGGSASNIEELDIFSNADFIQAEQIFSADTMPEATEVYKYTAGDDDVVYGYGKETAANKVRLVSVASGGAQNPGSFSTLFTSADATKLATRMSDFKFFRTVEASNSAYLYYIAGASTAWSLKKYNIGTGAETDLGVLSGLDGSYMKPTMKVIYGELFICHGQFIAKVDKDGTFTEKAFTMPKEWEAIDLIPVSDIALILARNKNKLDNNSKGFWWDLVSSQQFDDSFTISMGGPQWIFNHKEAIKIFCAINGTGKMFQLSGAFPGAVPIELPGISISNVAIEGTNSPISGPSMVGTKEKILYFCLKKTDKSGLYAIGQLDSDKPNALLLSKRFSTTDYSKHAPSGLLIQGSNFYAAYTNDDGQVGAANVNARCESLNSPSRSTQGTYESVWIDGNAPFNPKTISRVYTTSYPLPASSTITLSVASDFNPSYTTIKRADDSVFNTANGIFGLFKPAAFNNKRSYKMKAVLASSGVNSPKLQSIGLRYEQKEIDG